MLVKHKAFAYITRQNQLLVFEHPHAPEAGIQVPAGTIQPNESPEQAVMREAFEETGLTSLTLRAFLGETQRDMSDVGKAEIHHRYFYHLTCEQETPDTWEHYEHYASDGSEPIVFRFFWVELSALPEFIAGHGEMLDKL